MNNSEQQSPVLSIVLPFYNSEKTIDRAIRSIANQSFRNFECILVDNNSIDGGREIAKVWAKNNNRFRLISEPEQGVVFAFNKGAGLAKGQYIARMDADDEALPDRFKLQIEFLENKPCYGAIAGQANYIAHKNSTRGFERYVAWSNSIISFDEIYKRQFVEMPIINPTAMWRKSVSDMHGLYMNGDFPEDYEMWLRWLACGVKIGKLATPVLNWYDSDTRLTRTDKRYSSDAFYRIKTKALAHWLKLKNPFYPKVAIWGASKLSRSRANILTGFDIEISFFIDIKKSRQIDSRIIYYENIPAPNEVFILVYMSLEEARKKIQKFLESRGFKEAENYLLVS